MAYWLFKEEPTHYSWADLERDGRTRWDGVRNALAQQHLRRVRRGDKVFFYHTGKEKAVVGIMKAVSNAYPDPEADDDRIVVVDVEPVERLSQPVPLKAIRADEAFAGWELVRMSRLSVMPVPAELWKRILRMSRAKS